MERIIIKKISNEDIYKEDVAEIALRQKPIPEIFEVYKSNDRPTFRNYKNT
jgi:hypothetical protein